ncbi:hypothetical protein [Microbacterium sp. NPDC089695]|uniref:hypothetical protein n=1 Tax=Microbacterium sp. NPDC089695 TaxID=3364198 RepID=UPI003830DB00
MSHTRTSKKLATLALAAGLALAGTVATAAPASAATGLNTATYSTMQACAASQVIYTMRGYTIVKGCHIVYPYAGYKIMFYPR